MTGQVELPERTGPNPLLRPATAINTVGIPSPEMIYNKSLWYKKSAEKEIQSYLKM